MGVYGESKAARLQSFQSHVMVSLYSYSPSLLSVVDVYWLLIPVAINLRVYCGMIIGDLIWGGISCSAYSVIWLRKRKAPSCSLCNELKNTCRISGSSARYSFLLASSSSFAWTRLHWLNCFQELSGEFTSLPEEDCDSAPLYQVEKSLRDRWEKLQHVKEERLEQLEDLQKRVSPEEKDIIRLLLFDCDWNYIDSICVCEFNCSDLSCFQHDEVRYRLGKKDLSPCPVGLSEFDLQSLKCRVESLEQERVSLLYHWSAFALTSGIL